MSAESLTSHEKGPAVSISAPAIESLLNQNHESSPWPEKVTDEPALHEAIRVRSEAREALDTFIKNVPEVTINVKEALIKGSLDEESLSNLYLSLTNFFQSDPYNNRLALYLPFELLPQSDTTYTNESVRAVANQFSSTYLGAWRSLLHTHDIRANFVDGDIPEAISKTGPLPRAVVASRLIPALVERGILNIEEILSELHNTDDQILRENIADTLSVLADKQLISEEVLVQLADENDPFLRGTANLVLNEQHEQKRESGNEMIENLDTFFEEVCTAVKTKEENLVHSSLDMTEARRKWLIQESTHATLLKKARVLTNNLNAHKVSVLELIPYTQQTTDVESARVIALAIGNFNENQYQTTSEQQKISDEYLPVLTSLFSHPDYSVRNDTESALFHLQTAKIITSESLDQLGLNTPQFAASFSERGKDTEEVAHNIGTIMTSLETRHPELAAYVYPTAVLLGSRTKGYARENSDLDIAVFIRPEVSAEKKEEVQQLLKSTLSHELVDGSIMTFWLQETPNGLWIRDGEGTEDRSLGTTVDAHPLRGVWCGDKKTINKLHSELLPEYLYSKDKKLYGEEARQVWLEELERDTLQYRLMHKGYRRYFPQRGGINTPHSDAIDGQSVFYDSGYRRLATQLFVDRVFLPQLDRPKQ